MAISGGLLRVLAPADMRGRLQGLFATCTYEIYPLGTLLLGYAGDRLGAASAVGSSALLMAGGAALLLVTRPELRGWAAEPAVLADPR